MKNKREQRHVRIRETSHDGVPLFLFKNFKTQIMTEKEFQTQVWRPYDQITTANGVKGKVIGVAFNTKSVRAVISGAPEWVRCELIETHTSGKGGDCDDAAIIEELHNKVIGQQDRIDKLTEENNALKEKLSKDHIDALMTQVNIIGSQLQEKKKRMERIDASLLLIKEVVERVYIDNV